jgi:DNA polymerase-1
VPEQLSQDVVLSALKNIFENAKIKKYGQNIKYDLLVLRQFGVNIKGIHFDTMVASYCLNPSRDSHSLKALASGFIGFDMTKIEELIGTGKNQTTMDKVEVERVAPYAAADAVMVLYLAEIFEEQLVEKKLDKLFYEVEMPLVEILSNMQENGIKVDVDYFKNLSKEFAEHLKLIQKDVFELAGQEFNPNSPKQLAQILFEKLKLPVIKKTKTGFSTNEEVLNVLSTQHELPGKILEYRELQKLKSTYIDALLELVNTKTGRVHTSFNQTITATGRLSSSNPNLQNIPVRSGYGKKIRKGFVAASNNVLLSVDYSQIDLRSMAHISKDPVLVRAFNEGADIHTTTAIEVFNDAAPELRRVAKTINFGIIYGQSAFGLAQQLSIPNRQAKEYIESYLQKYSGVKKWMHDVVDDARKKGYVETVLGRVRYIPEINAKNGQIRAFAERTVLNTPIQGTSADIIKVAMINVAKKLVEKKYETKMLIQVHDELIFDVPEPELEKVSKMIKDVMENAVKLIIPVVVDLKFGKNWMEMKSLQ